MVEDIRPHSRLRPQCQPRGSRGIQERDVPQGDPAKSLPCGLGLNTWAQSVEIVKSKGQHGWDVMRPSEADQPGVVMEGPGLLIAGPQYLAEVQIDVGLYFYMSWRRC